MTRRSTLLAVTFLTACVVDPMVGAHSNAAQALSTPSPPRFVGPGVTLAIDDVVDNAAPDEPGVLAVTVTLANAGGVPLNVRYRDFALTASAERYPALLPSELGSTARHEILLREGVLRTGESLSAVLFFRTSPPTALLLELRVELTDVHDTPIGQAFVPILHAPASHG